MNEQGRRNGWGRVIGVGALLAVTLVAGCASKRGGSEAEEQRPDGLALAIMIGDFDAVRASLDRGDDPNAPGREGMTPLMMAAGLCEMQIVAFHPAGDPVWSVLHRFGDPRITPLLLERGADPHAVDRGGSTALFGAAMCGRTDAVQLLLAAGAKPNQANDAGQTPLLAAAAGDHRGAVTLLLGAGGDPNLADRVVGKTPLMAAAYTGDEELVSALLAAGAAVDTADLRGQTALFVAAFVGDAGVVDRLLRAGASPTIVNGAGESPLQVALRRGNTDAAERLQAAEDDG